MPIGKWQSKPAGRHETDPSNAKPRATIQKDADAAYYPDSHAKRRANYALGRPADPSGAPELYPDAEVAEGEEASRPLKANSGDVFEMFGTELPSIHKTKVRRWFWLIAFCVANAFCNGPMSMFNVLEPILKGEGVFGSAGEAGQAAAFATVMSLAAGAQTLGALPAGIIYDSYGPRWCAVVGTLFFAICCVGIGFAMRIQSLNWMLFFIYPSANWFGQLSTRGASGWQWLLPDDQNTVNALVMGVQSASDALVLVCVWLHTQYGMQLWTYFWAVGVLSIASCAFFVVIVPKRRQHIEWSAIVAMAYESKIKSSPSRWAYEPGSPSYGATDDEDVAGHGVDAGAPIRSTGWRWWDNMKGTAVTFRKYPVEHLLFFFGTVGFYLSFFFPMVNMFPFYKGIFGYNEGKHLLHNFSLVFGGLGCVAAIFAGRFMDYFSMKTMIIVFNIMTTIGIGFIWMDVVWCQVACQVIITLSLNAFVVMIMRFCMYYSPVQLFGTSVGVISLGMGLLQITLTQITNYLFKQGGAQFLVTFVKVASTLSSIIAVSCWTALLVRWKFHPPPAPGSITCSEAGIPDEEAYVDDTSKVEDDWC